MGGGSTWLKSNIFYKSMQWKACGKILIHTHLWVRVDCKMPVSNKLRDNCRLKQLEPDLVLSPTGHSPPITLRSYWVSSNGLYFRMISKLAMIFRPLFAAVRDDRKFDRRYSCPKMVERCLGFLAPSFTIRASRFARLWPSRNQWMRQKLKHLWL